MESGGNSPVHLSRARLTWLEEQSARWRDAGLIDAAARARILAGYETTSTERRSMIALVLVAVLMCAVGLVLLVGYNWEVIPTVGRVALILALVGGAFGASAAAYARDRPAVGEVLAFAGTIVFANAVLLIAEVLNMQGHFPDAVFWFGVGVLACAYLLQSTWIGIEAAFVFGLWLLFEGEAVNRPAFVFIPIWVATVMLAYRLSSPRMVGVAALSAALWVFMATLEASVGSVTPAAAALAGCALYAAGRWAAGRSPMSMAWQAAGLIVLAAVFVPLMMTGVHRTLESGAANGTSIGIAVSLAAIAFAGMFSRASNAADVGVRIVTATVVMWALVVWFGVFDDRVTGARIATVAFSVLALVMSISLIRTALTSSEVLHLTFGVGFALLFLIVRWVSVIENPLWSGLLLLTSGGGLLLVARLWRHRRQTLSVHEAVR